MDIAWFFSRQGAMVLASSLLNGSAEMETAKMIQLGSKKEVCDVFGAVSFSMFLSAVMIVAIQPAMGSVPRSMPRNVTNDTALYQNLSDIRVQRQKELSFDGDIARLSSIEGRYYERLPNPSEQSRLKNPIQRIARQQYRYSGTARN